ncbi:hypothetical protein LTR56_021447 [Elasticomyces elasticus]|nr:hypothetical protein LTR56_021447 [Elasticomyces elasticus]KAK3632861.1 hypothetical protein LTR22_020412 [Elasticomyces elasticus]KAK4912176.1 hypothetical protein LTR49_019364 [Elasticomyces elasticus]KAK5747678.1 hypothetical protein LTS12_022278 [Elasticomyces elasticus]
MSTTSNPGDSAPGLPSAAILFLIWAFMLYLARIWSKISKSDPWGSDGNVISLAMLAAICHVVSIYYAWHRGYRHGWTDQLSAVDQSAIKKSLYAAQLFFVASIGLTRTSTVLFTTRILTLGERHQRLAYALVTACGVSTMVLLLAIALRYPLAQPWNALDGSQEMFTRWVIVEVVGLVVDCGTLVFSVGLIWRLQMSVGKRLTVGALFAVRLLIVPVVAFRLAQLRPANARPSATYNNAEAILTEAELSLFLVLSSATCLKPVFQPFHRGFFAATDTNLAVTGYTNRPKGSNSNGREPYYELSGAPSQSGRDRKRPVSHVVSRTVDDDEVNLVSSHPRRPAVTAMRPDEGETWSEAVAGSEASQRNTSGGHHIEATRTWEISYEQRDGSGHVE